MPSVTSPLYAKHQNAALSQNRSHCHQDALFKLVAVAAEVVLLTLFLAGDIKPGSSALPAPATFSFAAAAPVAVFMGMPLTAPATLLLGLFLAGEASPGTRDSLSVLLLLAEKSSLGMWAAGARVAGRDAENVVAVGSFLVGVAAAWLFSLPVGADMAVATASVPAAGTSWLLSAVVSGEILKGGGWRGGAAIDVFLVFLVGAAVPVAGAGGITTSAGRRAAAVKRPFAGVAMRERRFLGG